MDVVGRNELAIRRGEFFDRMLKGDVFIHPTDTIYGLGCIATSNDAVARLRAVKQRESMPFSVIAPSKKWIFENCFVESEGRKWVEKLPGPYTLVLSLRNYDCVAPGVTLDLDTLGVRIPRNWFSKVVEEVGVPVVSTSANISGQDFMTCIEDLDRKVASKVSFAIYEGPKKGQPSTIVNLAGQQVSIIRR